MAERGPAPAMTSRQLQAQARREQILEAAVTLFAQQGFDGTSTRQIASAVGVTEGLIFHYFPTKADLVAAVLESRHGFIIKLREILADAERRPVTEILPQVAAMWLRTLRAESAIASVLFGAALTNEQVSAALQGVIREGIGRLAAYLRGRIQAGELRPDLPVEASAQMFVAPLMVFFLIHRTLSDEEWDRRGAVFTQELFTVWLMGAKPA
ncbi:MAG: TetR/AcrR family transcriptional regulator [Anaerolineae bacterium]